MDWTQSIDAYCERTDPSFWSEPWNAVSNLAFILAALVMALRTRGMPSGLALCAILVLIGVGSGLWHTFATAWSVAIDSGAIFLYVLLYIYLANKDFWEWPVWASVVGAAAYVPYSIAVGAVFDLLPFFTISSFYWPLPVLIFTYAWLLRERAPVTSRGLAIGAATLCVSLAFRSVDESVCNAISIGSHFMWHLLNAVMLGWMIEVWRRHRVEAALAEG